MVVGLVVVVGSAVVGIAVVGPVSPVRMSAPQRVQVLMCAWRAWRGLGWVFCSCRIHSGVPGGGVGSWSRRSGCFLVVFRGMGGLSGAWKSCEARCLGLSVGFGLHNIHKVLYAWL